MHLFLCRNLSLVESGVAILMAVAVGALGALVLTSNFYHDLWIFFFCFIMAGCQYCLLKVCASFRMKFSYSKSSIQFIGKQM